MDATRRPHVLWRWAIPAAVALAAVAGSLPRALADPMWGDEVASARVVSEPGVGEVMARVRAAESTPPAWYALAWGALQADDVSTGGALLHPVERLRLLSVLLAAGAAALTALWAIRFVGRPAPGLLAGMLVALGSVPAAWAAQLRAYALLTFISVVFGLLLSRVCARPSAGWLVALAVTAWVGALTHYFFLLTAVAGALWMWTTPPRPGRRHATVGLAAGFLGFLPWLPAFLEQRDRGRYRWIGHFDAGEVATLPASLFFGPEGVFYGLARIALTSALVVGFGLLLARRRGSPIVALALVPLAGAALLWAFGQPIFDGRNMLVTAPFLAIIAAASLSALPVRLVPWVAAMGCALVVLGAMRANATLGRMPYERVADALVELGWTARDPIFFTSPRAQTSLRISVAWYLPGRPTLAKVADGQCLGARAFLIGHRSRIGRWLAQRGGEDRVRRFPSYDHPARGERDGELLVARIDSSPGLPGAPFVARGPDPRPSVSRDARHCPGLAGT